VERLKGKLRENVNNRRKCLEDVVTQAADKIKDQNTIEFMPEYPPFTISPNLINGAIDQMEKIIDSWPGVQLTQCKKMPLISKDYTRTADNWWNRQKGKWFGNLLFEPILKLSLRSYCKKILLQKNQTSAEHQYVFFLFVRDILKCKVPFKKARPSPLIFNLVLEKSPAIHAWFSAAGTMHGIQWELVTKGKKKQTNLYAVTWAERVLELKSDAFYRRYGRRPNSDAYAPSNAPSTAPRSRSSFSSGSRSCSGGSDSETQCHSVAHSNVHSSTISIDDETDCIKSEAGSSTMKGYNTRKGGSNSVSDQQQADSQKEYNELKAMKNEMKMMEARMQMMQQSSYHQQQLMQHQIQFQSMQLQSMRVQSMQHDQQMHALRMQQQISDDIKLENYFPSQYAMPQYVSPPVQAPPINQPESMLPQPHQPNRYSRHSMSRSQEDGMHRAMPLPPPLKSDVGRSRRTSFSDMMSMYQMGGVMQDRNTVCGHSVQSGSALSAHTMLSATDSRTTITRQYSTPRSSQPPTTPRTVASDTPSRAWGAYQNQIPDFPVQRNPNWAAVYSHSFDRCGPQVVNNHNINPKYKAPAPNNLISEVPMYNPHGISGQMYATYPDGSPSQISVPVYQAQSSSVAMSAVAPHVTQESSTSVLGSVKMTPPQMDCVDDVGFPRLSNNNNSPDVNMGGAELIPLDDGNTDNLAFLDQLSMPINMNMISPPNNLFSSPNLLSGSNMMMGGSVTNMSMSSGNGNGNGIDIYQ